ncbi:amidohydrolase family protein [Polyangium sp. 6x1]|uniref:amidohydrolase family protein n=1 Tax=Polyangium sp. 6x1 TaxID=3042689 RepID=UPI0024829EFA|nr:amidohydrolase family protein [Polyangium sp. 6x1]MDI1449281.1 amidohydrolase family protein [Polyangium sp. 6x1]
MRNELRIFDADRHVIEPEELWPRYLESAWAGHAPYAVQQAPREQLGARIARLGARALLPPSSELYVDGEPIAAPRLERTALELTASALARLSDINAAGRADAQLRSMDAAGIDVAVLYPTHALYLTAIDGMAADLAAAFARAYNDWLRDLCREEPRRLRGAGLINRHDPGAMVAELERIVGFGWRAVVLRPNPIAGRTLGDPSYEPFWTACESLGVAVAMHEGTHARVPTAGADRFRTRFAQHACSHPMEQMMAFLALLEAGVLERHPLLKVAFLEAGAGWLPYWLWRLDEVEYSALAGEVAENVRQKPSTYFRRQCFVTAEPGEPGLTEVLRWVGEDRVLFGTDFPHLDHAGDIIDSVFRTWSDFPRSTLQKILWENPARFYNIER